MNNILTVITPIDNKILTKRFINNNGKIEKIDFDRVYRIDSAEVEFNTIEDLFMALLVLSKIPNACVIRGRGKTKVGTDVRRLGETRENGFFYDASQEWACFDVDKVEVPEDITEDQIPNYILNLSFPENFVGKDYIYQHSSSAGIGGSRLYSGHFWFLLEHPLTCSDLRKWGKFVNWEDPSTFKSVQPHYTADPLFDGVEDPIQKRWILFKADKNQENRLSLEIPKDEDVQKAIESRREITCNTDRQGYEKHIMDITAKSAHPHIKSAVHSYWRSFGQNCDWSWFMSLVSARMNAVGHPRANKNHSEVEELIRYATSVYPNSLNKESYKDTNRIKDKTQQLIKEKKNEKK